MQAGFGAPRLDLSVRCLCCAGAWQQLGTTGDTANPSVSVAFPTSPGRSHTQRQLLRAPCDVGPAGGGRATPRPQPSIILSALGSCATRGQHRPSRALSVTSRCPPRAGQDWGNAGARGRRSFEQRCCVPTAASRGSGSAVRGRTSVCPYRDGSVGTRGGWHRAVPWL